MLKIKEEGEFKRYDAIEMNCNILSYDIMGISQIRKRNTYILEDILKTSNRIKILRPNTMFQKCVPQTYPILLEETVDRYAVYNKLNSLGYGVVSLYHTLIEPLNIANYSSSQRVSAHILNLPIHQDVTEKDLIEMYESLKSINVLY